MGLTLEENYAEPFLRWAGGKKWIIKYLDQIVGKNKFNNYHEPFIGGGSVFFRFTITDRAYISDLNNDLIETYIAVRDKPVDIIKILREFENTKEHYYEIRMTEYLDPIYRAARFIYLNQTSFNGIYRVNKHGVYNVPYGYRTKNFIEEDKIFQASSKLKKAVITCGDFSCNKSLINKGDLIFLDPPYTVSHNNNGFIKYNQKLFSIEDQRRLSLFIDYIKSQEAFYILTNAAHQTIADIFHKDGDRRIELSRASLIGGTNARRGKITEYVFTNIAAGM